MKVKKIYYKVEMSYQSRVINWYTIKPWLRSIITRWGIQLKNSQSWSVDTILVATNKDE